MPEGTWSKTLPQEKKKPILVIFGMVFKGKEDVNVKEMGKDKSCSRERRGLHETHAVKIITNSHCP